MSNIKKPLRLKPKPRGLLFTSTSSKKDHASTSTTSSSSSSKSPQPNQIQTSKIRTRILILSDTHGHAALPHTLSLTKPIDLALHCGDLSRFSFLEDHHATLSLLSSLPAPLKIVIPGNHDLTLDASFWNIHCTLSGSDLYRQARELWTSEEAKKSGIFLLDDGMNDFVLGNGALLKIYASSATPYPSAVSEGNWAFGYKSNSDLYNPAGAGLWCGHPTGAEKTVLVHGVEVGVLMTHGPAKYRLDRNEEGDSRGCAHLFRAIRRVRPRVHVFGHCHAGFGAEVVRWREGKGKKIGGDDDVEDGIEGVRKMKREMLIEVGMNAREEETVLINGALMGREELERMPWVLEIELEKAGLGDEEEKLRGILRRS